VLLTRIWYRRKFGGGFLYGGQGNDFQLIPTAKMETRHPIEWSFGNEFRLIYNHCGVMAAWSRKTLKKFSFFLAFFGKTTGKFSKFCSKRIHFMKFGRREIGKIMHCLTDKKISPGSPALAAARIVPRICQGQSQTMYSECSRFHPNRSLLAELYPNAWTPSEDAWRWIQYSAEPSFELNKNLLSDSSEKSVLSWFNDTFNTI